MELDQLLISVNQGVDLNEQQIIELLKVDNQSPQLYELLALANKMSREEYDNQGLVFAQIGINAEPCSKNCKFCSMGRDHYVLKNQWQKDEKAIVKEVEVLLEQGINDLFLMTTADYPVDQYLTIAKQVKPLLPIGTRMVANIGDFDDQMALYLKNAGFTGAYHINRLREGVDTTISPEIRIKTLDAIRNAGLELYYCIEPIGPEHTYDELVAEILRAKQYDVQVMAVMRRIPVPKTPLFDKGQISAIELAKIAAVTRIAVKPKRSMNVHEPIQMGLLAGVNQLYAEAGANPRDTEDNTEKSRGFSVSQAWNMLWEAGYKTV